jgi:hypothetical protein
LASPQRLRGYQVGCYEHPRQRIAGGTEPPHVAVTRPGAVSSWAWNIRANPHVRLRIKGGSFAGVAHEIIDPAELDVARSVLCESVYPPDYAEASLHFADSRHGRKSKDCIGIGSTPDTTRGRTQKLAGFADFPQTAALKPERS